MVDSDCFICHPPRPPLISHGDIKFVLFCYMWHKTLTIKVCSAGSSAGLFIPQEPGWTLGGGLPPLLWGGICDLPLYGECNAWLSEPLLQFARNNLLEPFIPNTFRYHERDHVSAAGPSGTRSLISGRAAAVELCTTTCL